MVNLKECVNLEELNNEFCLLSVKPNMEMNLIKVGCFSGNEKLIRYSFDRNNTIRIWRCNDEDYAWTINTMVTDEMKQKRWKIKELVEQLVKENN